MFPFLYSRNPDSHKGFYGHALLIAGSCGKMGAAVLAARACLRSGVGLLTVHVPRCGVDIMQTAVPEAMLSIDNDENIFTSLPSSLERFDAVAVGPGLGTDNVSKKAFASLLAALHERLDGCRLVIDADGLNMLSAMPEIMDTARNAVLTPHNMEYQRLFADADTQQMCDLHELFIVRKGHSTRTFAPGLEPIQNNSGNPGMATAGSGDVLTGIMLSLLAQNRAYWEHGENGSALEWSSATNVKGDGRLINGSDVSTTAYFQKLIAHAVYLHGCAGDEASKRRGNQYSVIASDIIDSL